MDADRPVTPEVLRGVVQTMEGLFGRSLSSVQENFFHLGGRSMTLMVLLARIRKRFGVAVPPAAFLENPTAISLAALVDESLARAGERKGERGQGEQGKGGRA